MPHRLAPLTMPDAPPTHPPQDADGGTAVVAAAAGTIGPARVSGRESFAAAELAIALSHFDLGVISKIKEFPRGSRKAPKLLVRADRGEFLLKRRARGRDDPFKVAFTHELQLFLAAKQFPLPHLIGTRTDNNSMLQLEDAVYELFEYIPGGGYPQTLEATFESGRVLALFHKLLEEFQSNLVDFSPPTASYHRAPAVDKGLRTIPAQMPVSAGGGEAVAETCRFLHDAYRRSAKSVDDLGMGDWPAQVVHGDWHPGNMLFRDSRVVAVIDYDSARLLPRVIDSANGALQFSILGGDEKLDTWPDYLDETRFKRFLRGYDEVMLLSRGEVRAVPWLMIEALVAEAVFPIAATGHFGRLKGGPFLRMVQRKVAWLQEHAGRLVGLVES